MTLTVLNVAYPFATVDRDPVGGAEQVLSLLDRTLVSAGARSLVMAAEGSQPAGELISLPPVAPEIDAQARDRAHAALRRQLARVLETRRPDVVHLHGVDAAAYLPVTSAPVLVSLHLPLAWYPPTLVEAPPPGVWLAPVSRDQVRRGPPGARLLPPIENGVEVERFSPGRKRRFAVALGRICPEKGFHLALDAARAAGVPLLLAGAVFPYPEHRRYFAEQIAPRLGRQRRWLGPVTGEPKRRLLAAARCLVAASLAPETSSLVAREALAAGTPVAALRSGALGETLEAGRTGVLVETPEALPEAIRAAGQLSPAECRHAAWSRFSARRMAAEYLDLYRRLAAGERPPLMERLAA